MTDNVEQIEYWNGAGGKRWVEHADALDRLVRPFGAAAIERLRLQPGESVLDVGCGCGDSTRALVEAVGPTGCVSGIDVSAPMIARARERNPGVELIVADVMDHKFSRTFDACFSRFGVMFFAQPAAAFARLRAALAPAPRGRLSFVCWRAAAQNPWHAVPFGAVRSALPDVSLGVQDRPDAPGPFAFADPDLVARVLHDAGFGDAEITPFDADVEMSTTGLAAAVRFAVTVGPAARLLKDASPEQRQRAAEAVSVALEPHLTDGRIALRGAAFVVTARNT